MSPPCCDEWSLFLCLWRRNFFSISETHWGKVRAGQWHRAWALLGFIITGRGRRRKAGLAWASPSLGSSESEPPSACRAGDRLLTAVWGDSTQEGRRKQFLEGKTGGTSLFDLESLFAVCDQGPAPQSWSLCLLILVLGVLRAPLSFPKYTGMPS